jgi:hypothetical protein
MEIDPNTEPEALCQLIRQSLGCQKLRLRQFDGDIHQWVEVDEGDIEVIDGAKFQVIKEMEEVCTYMRCGVGTGGGGGRHAPRCWRLAPMLEGPYTSSI